MSDYTIFKMTKICKDANVNHRRALDSINLHTKNALEPTERRLIINEIEEALNKLKKLYEI